MRSGLHSILHFLHGHSILVLGFGREGRSTLAFLQYHLPEANIGIADREVIPPETLPQQHHYQLFEGENYLNAVKDFELIIKTPGIPTRLLNLKNHQLLTSQTDLFLAAFHHQTIGISGTKGKSTTSSLIFHLLKSTGYNCLLTGNIGIPCFDVIAQIKPDTQVVFELSAHQLENVRHSPHIAVLLNIFEEHLDHFGSFEAYREAKLNLIRFVHADDFVILHRDLLGYAQNINGNLKLFPSNTLPQMFSLQLVGHHNQWNAEAALMAVEAAGVPPKKLWQPLADFKGLPHRLEYLGKNAGVHFYNDSIATIPEACVAALTTLKKVDFLLLGGFDRGIRYEILTDYLQQHPVPHLLLTGAVGHRIAKLLPQNNPLMQFHFYDEMENAFQVIKDQMKPDDICLLSPAASSYDKYKNFEHRGEVFKALVRALSSETPEDQTT